MFVIPNFTLHYYGESISGGWLNNLYIIMYTVINCYPQLPTVPLT